MITEIRALCLGLFVTAVLARGISNSGFDKRPTPVLSTSFNSEVLSFLLFVVRQQIEFHFDLPDERFTVFAPCRIHLVYSFAMQRLGLAREYPSRITTLEIIKRRKQH